MLPGHKTNGAPRKSSMVAFPLLKWRGMAERKERLVQPKGLHWGLEPETFKPAKGSDFDFPDGKINPQKRWRRHPRMWEINNPFGSLWVWGDGLLLGFDCSTMWSRFQMSIVLIENAKQ